MEIKSFFLKLESSNDMLVSKKIAKGFGNNTSFLLSCIIQKDLETQNKIEINGDLYFEYTSDDMGKDANLSYKQQKTALQNLLDIGLIRQTKIGLPPKLHFSLNYEKINQLL